VKVLQNWQAAVGKMLMDTKVIALMAATIIVAPSTVNASTILVGSPAAASGIDGLAFAADGIDYTANVSFVPNVSYSSFYSASPPTFFGNDDAAEAAAQAIASFLTLSNVANIAGALANYGVEQVAVPTEYSSGPYSPTYDYWGATNYLSGSPSAWILEAVGAQLDEPLPSVALTSFSDLSSTLAVPLPSAGWLLLSGVGGLGVLVRKRPAT